jgi:uncharacterized membrane protein
MEVFFLLLLLIAMWFVWGKRYKGVTNSIVNLHRATDELVRRLAALERRVDVGIGELSSIVPERTEERADADARPQAPPQAAMAVAIHILPEEGRPSPATTPSITSLAQGPEEWAVTRVSAPLEARAAITEAVQPQPDKGRPSSAATPNITALAQGLEEWALEARAAAAEAVQPRPEEGRPSLSATPSVAVLAPKAGEPPGAAEPTSIVLATPVKEYEASQAEKPPPEHIKAFDWRHQLLVLPAGQMRGFVKTRRGEAIDWETLIGGSWLNVIGIVVFVVGVALLAQHSLSQFGPVGKISTGVATSIVFLVCGILLERTDRYRLLARTLIGGGWALLYFTGYAAYNIEASRIITDPVMGLLLMAGVATGIIVHSLRYRSQLLTALAYGLGFFAVTITPLNAYTLIASALLAVSQIAVLRFLPWHYLALIAVVGTYLNHARWLQEIIGSVPLASQPEFWLSQGILAFYWVLFFITALIRRPASRQEDLIQLTVSVANTIGMLGLSSWQVWIVHDENLHYLTGSAMLAYAGAAAASRLNNREDLFRFNASISVLLFAVTLPLALRPLDISTDWLAIYWTLGGLIVLGCGYLLQEHILRLEAYALCSAAWTAVFAFNLQSTLADWRSTHWGIIPSVIATFLGVSEWLQRVPCRRGSLPEADQLGQLYGYAATAILVSFLWKVCDPHLVGLTWLAAGIAFFEAGAWRSQPAWRNQGYILFALAFAALLGIDLYEIYPASVAVSAPTRWIIVGTSAAAYFYVFWRLRREGRRFVQTDIDTALADVPSFAGAALVTILAWKALDPAIVPLAWIFFALVLFEIGAWRSSSVLRYQGYILFALAFAALLGIDLYEIYPASVAVSAPTRWIIVGTSAAAYFYLFWRLRREGRRFVQIDIHPALADVPSFAGTALLTILAWKELDPVSVALAWGLLALVLFEVGNNAGLKRFTQQGHMLAGLTFVRLFMANFGAPGEAMGISHRILTVVPITALFYYFFGQMRDRPAYDINGIQLQMSRLYSWGGAIVLVALTRFELGRAYGVLGMAPLLIAFLIVDRYLHDVDFRFQAYILAILTFMRCWATNAYLIGTVYGIPERIVTMLPAVAAFVLATAICMRATRAEQTTAHHVFIRSLQFIDTNAHRFFALLGAALMAILFYYELPSGWVTIAWAIEALILLLIGMTVEERSFRIYGLVLLLLSLLKLVMIDVSGVEAIYRILSYIGLGLILLMASLIYTRNRSVIEKYI